VLDQAKLKTIKKITSSNELFIPISIFKGKASLLGAITVYMKDELKIKNADIARLLNKDYKSTWQAYQNEKKSS